MNLKIKSTLIFLPLFIASSKLAAVESQNKCEHENEKNRVYQCIRRHFVDIYRNHYKWLWDKLHLLESHVNKCTDLAVMNDFLTLYPSLQANAEVSEWYSEVLENLYVRDPKCVLEGLDASKKSTRTANIDILKNPVIVERKLILKISNDISKNSKYLLIIKDIISSDKKIKK